ALAEALERDPRSSYIWGLVGLLREAEGDLEGALAAYHIVDEIRPGSVQRLIEGVTTRLQEGGGD
ncbi:MAG: hypothetical protein JSV66_13300, partial [Trueperaceae bacterium]